MREGEMRATWDAAAAPHLVDRYVGPPETARQELESLFARLGSDPRGGVCIEVGCGVGRMTGYLAGQFDRVIAVDVSPAMLEKARGAVPAPNVEFVLVSGTGLEPLDNGVADAVVCYLVLQHLPRRRLVLGFLGEFARVLAPGGAAFVQLPVLRGGLQGRAWRALRRAFVPAGRTARAVERRPAYRGFRLTDRELARGLERAGLRVAARDEKPDSPYRHARDVFLRLEHA